jgi:F-type H+-transporting ATPase subunit epsilon
MQIEVVTPQGEALKTDADEVTAPGARGEFGVLPGHTPFIAALKPGVLTYKSRGKRGVIAVGAGYAEVSGRDRVIVLAQCAQAAEAIDVAAAQRELDDADRALKDAKPEQRAELEMKRAWAQARVDAKKA